MKRAYILATIFTVLGLGLSSFVLLGAPMPLQIKLTLALGIGIAFFYIGAAIVFLLALKGYKYRLKVAYRYVCASMFLVSVGTLQFLFLGALDAIDTAWVTQGWAGLPFALMALLAYLGMRIFAKLVDVKSVLTNVWVGLGLALGVGVLTLLGTSTLGSTSLDLPMAMNSFQATILVITAVLTLRIRGVIGALYASALGWSSAHYVILALAGVADVVSRLALAPDHWYHAYNVGTMPYFFAGLCVTAAAIQFNRIAYAENIKGAQAAAGASQGTATPVDVVVFLAGFASNRSRIDPILDKMRVITSHMGPDKQLTTDQQNTLADVYIAVEDFLITNEPLRQFKQSDLRQMVELRFHELATAPFWQKVRASQKAAPAQAPAGHGG